MNPKLMFQPQYLLMAFKKMLFFLIKTRTVLSNTAEGKEGRWWNFSPQCVKCHRVLCLSPGIKSWNNSFIACLYLNVLIMSKNKQCVFTNPTFPFLCISKDGI